MVRVRRYKDAGTDLQAVYKGIKGFLQETRDLSIANEIDGKIDGKPFMSISATKATVPRFLVGALREDRSSNVETYQALWFTRTPVLLEPKEISGTRKPSIDYAY